MKKTWILGLAILFSIGLFTMACKSNEETKNDLSARIVPDDPKEILPYNAILGLGGDIMFREDFLKANMTYEAIYKNENWDPEDDSSKEYLVDMTSPEFRTYIITEKAHLDEVFSVYPDIDLEKDMVVMYAYSTPHSNHQQILISITLDNKNLKIEFTTEMGKPGIGDASMPYRVFLPIRMDKLEIETVEFTQLHPSQVFRNSLEQI